MKLSEKNKQNFIRSLLILFLFQFLVHFGKTSYLWSQLNGKSHSLPMTVAVSEFSTTGLSNDLNWLGGSFADALIGQLSNSRQVRVVERQYLNKILEELKLSASGLIYEHSASSLGKLLGAKVFVFGSVAILGETIIVRARIVSVERGEILGVAETSGDKNNIFDIQKKLAQRVASVLAVESVISMTTGLETSPISINAHQDLDRLRKLAATLPKWGLDPARNRRTGDYQLALSICDRLLTQFPELTPAHYYKALFNFHSENFHVTEEELQILAEMGQLSSSAMTLKVNLFIQKRDFQNALQIAKKMTETYPASAWSWYLLGQVYLRMGKMQDAAMALLTAMENEPYIPKAETNLQTLVRGENGRILLSSLKLTYPNLYAPLVLFRDYWDNHFRNLKKYQNLIEQTLEHYPNLYFGYFAKGMFLKQQKNFTGALQYLQKSLTMQPVFPAVHRELGLILLKERNCVLGKQHITLYLRTTNFVYNYAELDKAIENCQ